MKDCNIKDHVKSLQKYAADNNLTRNKISKMIGVTAMTLGDFFTKDWKPKLETVIAIEAAFKKHETQMKKEKQIG